MEKNIIHTLPENGERVTSTYAEIYLDDEHHHCKPYKLKQVVKTNVKEEPDKDEWVSPSDLLIGILELKPPFTSRITRGITHEGILNIGNGVLEKEYAKFLRYLTTLLRDNDSAWLHIQEQEKQIVVEKVREYYEKIFKNKSLIMQNEITKFYESSLQDLEDHIKTEVQTVLFSVHSNMISDLNIVIKEKLLKEKEILEKVLQKKYDSEVFKLKNYYKLLLNNELYRSNRLINQSIHERNDALLAYCNYIQAEKNTTCMYVMCTERKKCRIKQFLLENFHSLEMREKFQKIKEKQEKIDSLKEIEKKIHDINKEWEEKTKKVLQLFLKFISFSLKLLPEQTTFLLDLEKLVVLQLNEIKKNPVIAPSILVDKDDMERGFKLEGPTSVESVCNKDPFVIEGDLADSIPTPYGSKETLPSHVDLPYIRVQRQFVYAKCQRIDEVRAYLKSRVCKCRMNPNDVSPSPTSVPSASRSVHAPPQQTPTNSLHDTESSNELLLIEDIARLHECPVRGCQDWAKRASFPNLTSYLDFTEENYARVKAILKNIPKTEPPPELIKAKEIAYSELPFSATKERQRHIATQYSSQEDLLLPEIGCTCNDFSEKAFSAKESMTDIDMNTILARRKWSLRRLIQDNPKLLKMFTDESFDFQL